MPLLTVLTSSLPQACDKCREQKCKCVPDAQHPSTCAQCFLLGVSCTYRGPSHKRGPPKGYLSAVISRLEAMEDVILHKLSRNTDDPQARALLRELIGDVALGQVLSGRLKFGDRIDASGGGDGISFSPSASSVKKGSGPNGTTWQDTWWVSTPGVPTSHPRPSANRSLASRFPTTNVSVGTAMDLTPPVNAGNFPPPAFTSGDNPSTGFQSGDVSPKSIGRTATSVAVIGSSGQWQQPQQADAQNHRQSPAEPIRQGDALTPSLTALRVAEYGSDLASFWRGIADAQRAPAVGDKNLLEISLVVHDGTGSAAGKSTRLYRDGHNELARLTHAMEAMQTTETGSDAGRMRSPLPSERPVIQRGVCHVTVKVSEKHLDIAAGDQGSDALDDVAIARYFASDHHWNFPVVHYRYYRAMQARHEHGEKVIGFKDAYAGEQNDHCCPHYECQITNQTFHPPLIHRSAAMALAAGTESTTESALCLEQSEKISLLRVAAALVHGYRALRLAHLVEAASYSSLAACWAQQLGLHRWHVVTDNPTNEEDDDQRHASQLLWSGCVVLDQLLKTTGITTTLTIDRAFSEMPPLLPSSTDSLRAVFDPSVDFDTALNSVVGLAGLHSLAVILSHTEQYAREIARRPVNGVQETLSALDRRLSRWSSMVEHTLDIVFEDCHGFAIGQSSAAMSTSREALAITTALVEQHAKLNINARLPPPFARMSVPQKVVTAIADQASSFANSRPAAVTRALSHPWSLTAMFAGGVEILISMQNGAKSDQVDAVKEDLDVVRNTLQAQRESCELACFYDDILTSVQGPKNASSQAEPAVSLPSEGDSDDGSGQGHDRGAAGSSSRGPSSTNGNGFGGLYSSDSQHGLNTSYHRTHNSNSSNNPFCQSASFSSTTNPSSDINSTPIASGTSFTSRLRGQAPTLEPASSSSVVRSSSPRAPSPETPTPIPADHSPYGWRANSSSNLRSRMDVELEGQLQRHGREVADQARSRVAVDGRQPTSLGYAPMKQAANGSEHGFLDTAVASIAHLNGLFSRSTRSSARSSPSAHRRQESPRDYFAPQRPLSSSHTPFGGDRTGAVFGSGGHGHNSGGVPTGASSLTEADFRPHTAAGNNSPDILSLSDRRDVSSGRFFAPSNNSRVPAALSGSPTSLTNLTAAPLVSSPSIQRAVTIANAGLQAQFATQNTSLRLSPTIARSSTSPTAPLQIFAAVAAGAAAFPTPGATLPRSSDDRDEGDHGSMMETGPIATADKEQLAIDTSTMMDTDTSMDGEGLPEDVDTTTHTSVLPTSSTLEDALGIANTTATLKSESQTRVETEQASSAISSTPSPSSTDTAVTATTTVNYTGTSAAEAAAAAVPTAVTSLAPSTTASLDLPIDSQLILKVESTPQVLPL